MFDLFLENRSLLDINGGVLLVVLLLTLLGKRERAVDRILFGGVTVVLLVVYLIWRATETLPEPRMDFPSVWAHVFFGFECMALAYTLISVVVLSRTTDHTPDADAGEAALRRAAKAPRVDIFIATYNEGLDILEKTIVSALAIDYPDFRVWVLDDTRRDWLKAFCEQVGAHYVTRADNTHAKAGNLNNGLCRSAQSEDGGAPYIMVLDADFAPHRKILLRTIGLFSDPAVGVVQTPQFYYNADPVQYNLRSTECWVDEQRAFFDVMQPAKDAWGTAFCIGTSFVVRRDLVELIGGFPTGTVTEDIHLTYRLLPHGYVTRWLNERLSVGLSAEGLPEYISQRSRWGLGTIQVALTRDGPLRGRGYTFIERLHYVHGMLHWLSRPFTLMLLLGPLLYWYFDVPTLYGEPMQFLAYGLPALIGYWGYSMWITGRRALPIFTEVTQIVCALAVSASLASAIIRPFGRPFKVTNKGLDRSKLVVHGKFVALYASLIGLSALGLGRALLVDPASPGLVFNSVWTSVSLALYLASLLVCVELPRPRKEERFPYRVRALLRLGEQEYSVTTHDLSCNGAAVTTPLAPSLPVGSEGALWLEQAGWIPCRIARRQGSLVGVALHADIAARHCLIRMLFGDPPHNVAAQGQPRLALSRLMQRALSG
ncbi:glycosyltransferase [Burkholderia oklahomensis]|uniref:cellulose synthase (UDP-forming) n=1 Tax=Burkholderia oklahomensis TaxID=342113 RepID=A0AAI8FR53_9BURK|nr:glycosyltransferase [Burkholderia oklahomensis]AIO69675.1 glycosyl transferase 2 family protein [Burkholderia oklahomensis]AOI39694.1 cellulose synthase [Burkholderia oklahomensis EO147]KUY67760.1 cellulose synthase [Burkholderia oklahomensis EO147]QPS39951.1 glycosyltransferase [Burkholderia oklahomensis]